MAIAHLDKRAGRQEESCGLRSCDNLREALSNLPDLRIRSLQLEEGPLGSSHPAPYILHAIHKLTRCATYMTSPVRPPMTAQMRIHPPELRFVPTRLARFSSHGVGRRSLFVRSRLFRRRSVPLMGIHPLLCPTGRPSAPRHLISLLFSDRTDGARCGQRYPLRAPLDGLSRPLITARIVMNRDRDCGSVKRRAHPGPGSDCNVAAWNARRGFDIPSLRGTRHARTPSPAPP